ncbi:MAG: hypothetical protein AB2L26_13055 [Ignavibacteria bacterium]
MRINKITASPFNHFCGYFDKTPWNKTGEYIFAHRVNFNDRIPGENDCCDICIINTQTKETKKAANTYAWNWQQGAMTQWAEIEGSEYIVFNERRGKGFSSVCMDTRNFNIETVIECPISSLITPDNKFLSINFSRLFNLRKGYGYAGVNDTFEKDFHPTGDGIFAGDFKSGSREQIISLDEIANFGTGKPLPGFHYINHTQFNDDFSKFSFFHIISNEKDRYIRLFVCDVNGSNLKLIHEGIISHLDWIDNRNILAWIFRSKASSSVKSKKTFASRIARKIYGRLNLKKLRSIKEKLDDRGFYIIDTQDVPKFTLFARRKDGHPKYSPDKNYLVIDSYPDGDSKQNITLYDLKDRSTVQSADLESNPSFFGHFRCDLHPKWNRESDTICVDSSHDGTKQIYFIDGF